MRAGTCGRRFREGVLVAALALGLGGCVTQDDLAGLAVAGLGEERVSDLERGLLQFREGNFGEAQRIFQRVVEVRPDELQAWLGLAAAYDRLERFDLADRAYAEAARLGGRTPTLLNNQAYSYFLRGDLRKARATFQQAIKQWPAHTMLRNNFNRVTW
jgi:Flp pilus assembly protein TadD